MKVGVRWVARVGLSVFPIEILVLSFGIIAGASGCAGAASDLPPDYSSVDARERIRVEDFDPATVTWSCPDIEEELSAFGSVIASQEEAIAGKRTQNQVATFVGMFFFLPALLATDNGEQAKRKMDDIYLARDKLYLLQVFKNCSS